MNKARTVEGITWKEIAMGALALVNAMLGYWLRLQREELKAQALRLGSSARVPVPARLARCKQVGLCRTGGVGFRGGWASIVS